MLRNRLIASVAVALVIVSWMCAAKAEEGSGRFSKLGFLKGRWATDVKTADHEIGVTDLVFNPILDGKFLQIDYTVATGQKKKSHHVIVGEEKQGKLKGWTFTSDGNSYESAVEVRSTENECVVTVLTGGESVVAKFKKTPDNTFKVEYGNAARKAGDITATFHQQK